MPTDPHCIVPECTLPILAKELCTTHYHQKRRGQPFGPSRSNYRGPACTKGKGKCAVRGCERPDKVKEFCGPHYQVARSYGVSAEEIAAVLNLEVSCDVCGSQERMVFDHDHTCCPEPRANSKGITCGQCRRGVLCNNCNTALGMVKDDVQTLTGMIEYLTPKAA